jgi:hypothetical protein
MSEVKPSAVGKSYCGRINVNFVPLARSPHERKEIRSHKVKRLTDSTGLN